MSVFSCQVSKYDGSQTALKRIMGKLVMGRGSLKALCVLALCLFASFAIAAEPFRYVNDYLVINLRSGKGDEYRVIRTLPTGARLRVLEEDGDHLRVRTDDDIEGWVRGQYLRDTPVARDQLVSVQASLDKREKSLASLKSAHEQLSKEHKQLQVQAKDLQTQVTSLSKENVHLKTVAARPLELEQENKRVKEQFVVAEAERMRLQAENDDLRASTSQKWFAAGGGILVLGILMGIILPKFRRRRQSGWS